MEETYLVVYRQPNGAPIVACATAEELSNYPELSKPLATFPDNSTENRNAFLTEAKKYGLEQDALKLIPSVTLTEESKQRGTRFASSAEMARLAVKFSKMLDQRQ